MDAFKVPQIPSSSKCRSIDAVLSKEGLVVTPERPPVAPSPGIWQDIGEMIQKELPESQGNLEGWGSVSPEKQTSRQETRHRAQMRGIGLKEEELEKVYNYPGEKMNQYLKELTLWQKPVVKQIRRQYKNSKSAVASRKRKGRDLDLIRKLLDHKKRQRDSLRATNKQLEVRLEQVKAKKEALINSLERAIAEKNPKTLDPVNQGFCTLGEFLNWFHPGK